MLAITVTVLRAAVPKPNFFTQLNAHKMDLHLPGWLNSSYEFGRTFAELLHPINIKDGFGESNGESYNDPALDKQWAKTNNIADPKKRIKARQQFNEMTMKKVAVIPLHYQENDYAVRKNLGIQFSPRADNWLVFNDMAIDKRAGRR